MTNEHQTNMVWQPNRHTMPETIQAECIGLHTDAKGVLWVSLENEMGVKVEINGSLFVDNGLPVPDGLGPAEVSAGVYDHWFGRGDEETRATLAKVLHRHFDGILASRQTILEDLELYMVRIEPTTRSCAIGALLEAWGRDPLLLLPEGSGCITNLSLDRSGRTIRFTAWHPRQGFFQGAGLTESQQRLESFRRLRSGSSFIRGMIRLAELAIGVSSAPRIEGLRYNTLI